MIKFTLSAPITKCKSKDIILCIIFVYAREASLDNFVILMLRKCLKKGSKTQSCTYMGVFY